MQDTLTTLVDWYTAAEDATVDSRAEAERDRDYRNGAQWTAAERAALEKRKQPIVTIDRIGPKIDFLLGMEQSQRTDPKAYPRNPADEDGANAATDALRYVMDYNRWDNIRSDCFDEFIVEGVCGVDVAVEDVNGEACITVAPIHWDRLFYDPHSRKKDFSDAKYLGQFIWMDLEDAQARWPDKAEALESSMSRESALGDTHDDLPRLRWADPKRRRVRVVSMWSNEGSKVFYSVFTKAGVLERMESPYRDDKGRPTRGFIFGSCYMDRDATRFGVVRRWISLQDEINKRRSKAMHLLNVRQVKAERGAVDDVNKARAELAKPDGYVEVVPGMLFDVLPTGDMAAAQFSLLQEAKSEIDAVGVNAALSGNEQRVMSGRALMARSEQGMNELGPVFDGFKRWQLDVYRQVWNCIRQFWTSEKWVRVTDNEDNTRFVGLNRAMTLGDQLLDEAKKQGIEITPEMKQQAEMDPRMQTVVGVRNNVAEMDVDITIDASPASQAIQAEQFQALADMAGKGIPIPPDAIVEASGLRNKQKILEAMRGKGEIPPQVQQQLQQAEQTIAQLQQALQALQAQAQADEAKRRHELQMQLLKEQAETLRKEADQRAAYDREELKALVQLAIKEMAIPSLTQAVQQDIAAEPQPSTALG